MTRRIHLTSAPDQAVQAHLPGRRLIAPSGLAALTWDAVPCTLDDLAAELQWSGGVDDAGMLRELAALLAEPAHANFALPSQELLAVLRALVALKRPPQELTSELHALALEFDFRLRSRDPADEPQTEQPSSALLQPLLVYGYSTLTTGQVEGLTRLAGPGSVIVLPEQLDTRELVASLTERGWQPLAPVEDPEAVSLTPPQVMEAGDPLHEARTAMMLAAELQGTSEHPPQILVTARHPDSYRTALTVASRERDLTLHWLERSHAQTTSGAFLTLVATVLTEDWSYESVCSLLASLTVGELAPGQWQAVRKAGANGQHQWAKPSLLPGELAVLRTLPDRATSREWDEALSRLPGVSDLIFELHVWMAPRLPEVSDQRTYGAVLKSALRRPAPGGPIASGAIIIAPPDALAGARGDLVLALGLTEGVWPSPPAFCPPLDAHVRAALSAGGLEVDTAAAHTRRERALYQWAQLAAPRFVAFVPQVVGSRRQLPSDLVIDVPLTPAPPHALRPTDPYQSSPSDLRTHPPIDLIDRRFSPTQLTRFGQCAFRWYAQYGLGLSDLHEPQSTLAPDVRGRLYHLTLDHVAQELKEDPAADRLRLVEVGFAAAEEHEGLSRLVNWNWQRAEHLRHLHDLVISEEFLPKGHQIVDSEAEFVIDWNGLAIHGTLDRLDQTPDGYEVTDYKTGTVKPKGAKGEGNRLTLDVQLPVYLAAAGTQTGVEVTKGRYLSLTGTERRILGTFKPDQEGLDQLVQDLFAAADQGHFPANPDAALDACTHCSYMPLCRHGGVPDDGLD